MLHPYVDRQMHSLKPNRLLSFIVFLSGGLAAYCHGQIIPTHDVTVEDMSSIIASVQVEAIEYKNDFGEFPHGDNNSMMRSLCGLNPKNKIYIYLNKEYLFDGTGNLLDPWLKPYSFSFDDQGVHMFSVTYQNSVAHPPKNWMPGMAYYPLPIMPTKEQLSQSRVYKLALCIRLLMKRRSEMLPPNDLARWLVNPVDKTWPYVNARSWPYTTLSDAKRSMIDPWSSCYRVHISDEKITVKSIHSKYVATENLNAAGDTKSATSGKAGGLGR